MHNCNNGEHTKLPNGNALKIVIKVYPNQLEAHESVRGPSANYVVF